ncbi:hypothetical protein CSW14_10480 [Thermus scotoductus]|jgi:hypothetical protein|uniref:Uncharacterized protein n=1 Tax=Thermus scotoductus TaxID=37636 RepID=A0A430VFY0_THESC|nr:hypothetical protein [Thermus scotoductus]RTI49982.1 hypothetical protein CSW14_10480 [Thermus scotoductus]
MPKLMKQLTRGASELVEPLYVAAMIPIVLAAGWVALAAAPVASAWIKRLQPPKDSGKGAGGSGNAGGEDAPKDPYFTVVLNPGLSGGNTKANQKLAGMVAYYLTQGNPIPVVNLANVSGYYARLQKINDLAQQGKKPLVITLASAPLRARLRGAVVTGVAMDVPSATARATTVAQEALSMAQILGKEVQGAFKDGGDERAYAGAVDLWKEPTTLGNPNGIPPEDIYFHKTLSDGIDHGGIRLDFLKPDKPAILGPNGKPMAVHGVWLNYLDGEVDAKTLSQMAQNPHFGLPERIAGRLARAIRMVAGYIPSLPPAPR